MKKNRIFGMTAGLFLCLMLAGCAGTKTADNEFQDGYYTAVMSEYDFGWKEYVTICVMDNKIVNVEYNAKNPAGFIKSWDMAYMRNMNPVSGTYPNRYTRSYAAAFLENQNPEEVDLITGATSSGNNFRKLTAAVLENARTGNTAITEVAGEPSEE